MLKLQFVDNRQSSFWIVDDEFGIGREIKNQMVIKDDQVQPFHARIRQKNKRVFVEPIGDDTPTYVNGSRIHESTELLVGDVVGINQIELKLIDPTRNARVANSKLASIASAGKSSSDVKWQIKAMTGPLAGKLINIDGVKRIGRDPALEIVISGGHVSRRHAELLLRDDHLWVRDLNSSNGTYVNAKKTNEVALYLGDEVKIDAVVFRVVQGIAPKANTLAAEAENLDKTQFHPAINVPPPATPSRPRPIPAHLNTPLPTSESATPLPTAPIEAQPSPQPLAESATPVTPVAKGLRISPVVLLLLLLVLGMLATLVFIAG
ncbi:MAG: FHA domain-containing protein [Pseudomonadota bacterium]|nr:FHA domain-containing protein [Pseudomonadota bacterium]